MWELAWVQWQGGCGPGSGAFPGCRRSCRTRPGAAWQAVQPLTASAGCNSWGLATAFLPCEYHQPVVPRPPASDGGPASSPNHTDPLSGVPTHFPHPTPATPHPPTPHTLHPPTLPLRQEDYPYLAREDKCVKHKAMHHKAVTVDGYQHVPHHNETALMQSLTILVSTLYGAGAGCGCKAWKWLRVYPPAVAHAPVSLHARPRVRPLPCLE